MSDKEDITQEKKLFVVKIENIEDTIFDLDCELDNYVNIISSEEENS